MSELDSGTPRGFVAPSSLFRRVPAPVVANDLPTISETESSEQDPEGPDEEKKQCRSAKTVGLRRDFLRKSR